MHATPVRLNASIGWLFVVGSACFALGSVPAYVDAVGGVPDAVTFFVGSIFFTAASFGQLVQAQSPAMSGVDEVRQHDPGPLRLWAWRPHDRAWCAAATQFPGTLFFNISTFAALAHNLTVSEENRHVWRPDMFGSTLFLIASAYGILAVGGHLRGGSARSPAWWIAWVNMAGSVFFMASALASYVVPSTGELVDSEVATVGTLLGAVCFLVGAALMFPAWRHEVMTVEAAPGRDG
jgi:hypothetical protein